MSTLIVLRHAKADSPPGVPDAERPLAPRGVRDARAAGAWLRASGHLPDRVVCSTALRTRRTLAELGLDAPADFDERVYAGDAEQIVALLREQDDDAATLMLVGHNPSAHRLVFDLAGAAGDGFPTCATAVIEFDGGWSDLWPGCGRLTALWTP